MLLPGFTVPLLVSVPTVPAPHKLVPALTNVGDMASDPFTINRPEWTVVVPVNVPLPVAGSLAEAGERLTPALEAGIDAAVESVPDEWLGRMPAERRTDFRDFLHNRLDGQDEFIKELEDAR